MNREAFKSMTSKQAYWENRTVLGANYHSKHWLVSDARPRAVQCNSELIGRENNCKENAIARYLLFPILQCSNLADFLMLDCLDLLATNVYHLLVWIFQMPLDGK